MAAVYWHVPDDRLKSDSAARAATATADRIARGIRPDTEPDEKELFVALHACALRASDDTSDEQAEWAHRWRLIREHIVESNLGLAYAMMQRFGSRRNDEDAALSDALFGLTRAIDRFNPWKGFRFSTYACNVIARFLLRQRKKEQRYRAMVPVQYDTSLEKPFQERDEQAELFLERLQRILDRNLGELSEIETQILSSRFPQNLKRRLTFQEIGKVVGLSKERVRQIQNVALGKLREVMKEDPVLQGS
jgi:RNA polymerase sigma factor (sigma-70 family)